MLLVCSTIHSRFVQYLDFIDEVSLLHWWRFVHLLDHLSLLRITHSFLITIPLTSLSDVILSFFAFPQLSLFSFSSNFFFSSFSSNFFLFSFSSNFFFFSFSSNFFFFFPFHYISFFLISFLQSNYVNITVTLLLTNF